MKLQIWQGEKLLKKSNKAKKNYFSKWWQLLKYSPTDAKYCKQNYPRVVAIGGGTGLSALLRGLRFFTPNITAVVAVTDNGQSSGFIRKAFDSLPPGDIRKCICALSPKEDLLVDLLTYRFKKGRGLNGHSLGNLLMVALSDMENGFDKAIMRLSEILQIVGCVLPVTLDKVHIIGQMDSGVMVEGETQISERGHTDSIRKISLTKTANIYVPVKTAIEDADIIVLGPGSLYTSVIPPLLVKGMASSLKRTRAKIIYVCNISTERGETEGYGVENHINAVKKVIPRIDYCLVNTKKVRTPNIKEGELGSVVQLFTKCKLICGVKIIHACVVDDNNLLCHNSTLLAKTIIDSINTK
jgi:uncharacterized cofD-like protein